MTSPNTQRSSIHWCMLSEQSVFSVSLAKGHWCWKAAGLGGLQSALGAARRAAGASGRGSLHAPEHGFLMCSGVLLLSDLVSLILRQITCRKWTLLSFVQIAGVEPALSCSSSGWGCPCFLVKRKFFLNFRLAGEFPVTLVHWCAEQQIPPPPLRSLWADNCNTLVAAAKCCTAFLAAVERWWRRICYFTELQTKPNNEFFSVMGNAP